MGREGSVGLEKNTATCISMLSISCFSTDSISMGKCGRGRAVGWLSQASNQKAESAVARCSCQAHQAMGLSRSPQFPSQTCFAGGGLLRPHGEWRRCPCHHAGNHRGPHVRTCFCHALVEQDLCQLWTASLSNATSEKRIAPSCPIRSWTGFACIHF